MGDLLDRTIDAARLTRLLRTRHPGVEVAAVDVLDDTSGSANRLRLGLTYAAGADGGLPATMFLKRNLERFNFPASMYTNEVRIYRDVLPGTGVETPAIYAIEASGDDLDFAILMEDLATRPGLRIGFVLDATTPDEIASLLATLARLHAAFWGGAPIDRVAPWARTPDADEAMRFWAQIGPRLTQRHLERGHRAVFADRLRWPQEHLWAAFDRMVAADSDGPHTLLHGDVHAGNVYYVADGDGGLLDWQLVVRGCWALDVGYLLTSALSIDDRRANERALLDDYLARLRALGVEAPGGDEAWRRYRQNALYGLMMWLLTPDGVHVDDAQLEYLRRHIAAAEDLETLDVLT
jgi:aminoglycoside phosphotransferase (APT) family kinase protein